MTCCAAVLVIDLLGWICFTKDGNRHMRHMFIDTYADLKHIEVETGNCINNDTRHCILKWRHWAYLEWLDTPRNQPFRDIDSPGFSPCVLKHTRKKSSMSWMVCILFLFCTFNFDKDIPESNKCPKKIWYCCQFLFEGKLGRSPTVYFERSVFAC